MRTTRLTDQTPCMFVNLIHEKHLQTHERPHSTTFDVDPGCKMLEASNIERARSMMDGSTTLTPTLEDYLEAIARLVVARGDARVRDIAEALSVHKSTVTTALRSLASRGLINYRPYSKATLTPRGRTVAQQIVRRHDVISRFLTDVLSVPKDAAEESACKIEHAIAPEILDRLSQFIEFVEQCPRGGTKWIRGFGYFCEDGCTDERCKRCMELCLNDFQKKRVDGRRRGAGEEMSTVMLDKMKPGQRGKIARVGGAGAVSRRLVDMGVVRGTTVEVIKVAPLGDPIEVKLKGYNLSLRKEEAAGIKVEMG